MDFFEHQDLARRNTRRLVLLMTLAVASLILLTTLLVAVVNAAFARRSESPEGGFWAGVLAHTGWEPLLLISLLVGATVLAGGLFKWFQLRSGGLAVAQALGGQLVPGNTEDVHQRQLLNVVEEMAIASGLPVPMVFLLEDQSINAFAAGHGPHDAVIGVTRGCIEQLHRSELQGVIAHEFSHILHGDMRLNLRLVAVLNGILLLGLLGRLIVYGGHPGHPGHHRDYRRGGGNRGKAALIGVGLIILGAIGTFFGNWIKAAVSRQREFLADASAVQYTRNPEGIGGALMKIGGIPAGARLSASDANEFSHMYFEEGVSHRFTRLMATHPPLKDRIQRILPGWDGHFPAPRAPSGEASGGAHAMVSGFSPQVPAVPVEDVPTPDTEALYHARAILSRLPRSILEAAREPFGSRGIFLGLALSQDDKERAVQKLALSKALPQRDFAALKPIINDTAALPASERLPAIELALPALTQLSDKQREAFLKALDKTIRADGKIQLREWIIYRLAQTHLSDKPSQPQRLKLRYCLKEAQLLLALAALSGTDDLQAARAAYQVGANHIAPDAPWPERDSLSFAQLDRALDRLRQLRPLEKPPLLKALRRCLRHDETITPAEAELYRALADTLDCPTPPLSEPVSHGRG
ncbi:M48 family metallopeptidase [Marinimicrobium locisalis]|uniref:M48 family metallopeptidase n=1 Tax=Marinimicrobium locisalis TaxID=546022 RepID=UPI00322222CD